MNCKYLVHYSGKPTPGAPGGEQQDLAEPLAGAELGVLRQVDRHRAAAEHVLAGAARRPRGAAADQVEGAAEQQHRGLVLAGDQQVRIEWSQHL